MDRDRIVTFTLNPAIDNFSAIKRVVPGRKLRCSRPRQYPGGGGINVSRGLKALGRDSLAVFTSGGTTGRHLRELLEAGSIEENAVPVADMTRESLVFNDESSGQQFRFNFPGPVLKEDEWKECLGRLEALEPPPVYIVASGSLPPGTPEDIYKRVAEIAKRKSAKCIIDASGPALLRSVEAGVFMIKPNVNELKVFFPQASLRYPDGNEAEQIASGLAREGKCEAVVVSLGRAGALLATKGGTERLDAPQVEIKNKVGAGDNMVAGIVFGLSSGMNVREAVLFGIAAGSSTVACEGSGLCDPDLTRRLYEKLKM